MAITGERRVQLNSIIERMKANNEDDSSIREMVSQFKAKYDKPEEEPEGVKITEGVTLSPEEAKSVQEKSIFHTVPKAIKEFAVGAVKEPGVTATGIASGIPAAIPGKTPVKPVSFKEEMPDVRAEEILKGGIADPSVLEDIKKQEQQRAEREAITKPIEERAKKVGEFATKTGVGLALSTAAPGAGLVPAIKQGFLANIPFALGILEDKGLKDVAADVAINTAIDVATFGMSKAIPSIKTAIMKKIGKDITEETAEKMAKEAFQQVSTKEVKEAVERGFKAPSGQEILPTEAPKKKLLEKGFGRLKEAERSILSEPLKATDTPFTEYAKLAKSSIENPRNPTPLDFAGTKGSDAVKKLDDMRKVLGQKKGDLIEGVADETIDIANVSNLFNDDVKKFMGVGLTDGKIKGLSKAPSQNKLIEDAYSIVSDLGENASVRDLDNAKSALFDLIESKKAGQIKPAVGKAEAVVKKARSEIDKLLEAKLGPDFKDVNKKYGQLKDDIAFLNKKFGQVVDPETGVTERGASLLKTALQSNSDKGTKAVFDRVLEETGIDLIKEAKFAEIAMEAVGDTRAKGLVKEVSKPTIQSLIVGGAKKGFEAIRGDKLDELINFYNKVQGGK